MPEGAWNVLWVTDFPLVGWNDDEGRWDALHHPFTSPTDESLELLESQPAAARARAYDLVLNGTELGGGSIRINRPEVQYRVLETLGIDRAKADERFGFLIEALKHGAPPHGGIAFGLDRIAALLAGRDSIRDVIAFPKTASGTDPADRSPRPAGAGAAPGAGNPRRAGNSATLRETGRRVCTTTAVFGSGS